MENTRVTIKLEDLVSVVRSHATDDPRLAIFMLNDMGFEEACKRAKEDRDTGLLSAILMINARRTDDGEDAVMLIDMIDDGQF